MNRLAVTFLTLACAFAGVAFAQEEPPPLERLEGTLLKARSSGAVTIAHRESSIPFSYLSTRGEPIGYSIELCRRIVEAMSEAVGRELGVKWFAVTSESRIDSIASGKADLECGSTTNNLERAALVAFSPTIFVSGTKLMVKRGSAVRSFRDLKGKKVVVTAGTTNEQAMRDLAKRFNLDFTLVTARDHAESYAQVASGAADAFASDEVLLYGLIARNQARDKFDVIGEMLSYDPYGIMYRKGDAQMRRVVNDTFRELAQDGEVERQYKRWFLKRLPSGEAIDLPISQQLETLLRAMTGKPE